MHIIASQKELKKLLLKGLNESEVRSRREQRGGGIRLRGLEVSLQPYYIQFILGIGLPSIYP